MERRCMVDDEGDGGCLVGWESSWAVVICLGCHCYFCDCDERQCRSCGVFGKGEECLSVASQKLLFKDR